ncbi:HTH-type transcriptional regulatory protein GabR [Ensifer sp. M14]|uniref:MocR-like pyridoxine biosynthesis transcription factor PdxR n=1 Tax=Ensifer sp. M14 TaxID=2203782 RepID=UPI000E1D5DCA|nr:PLP-dependent aminotransferase family protein [Ensifer sp. M14]RDL48759.1 HTH-type transcriptional regulatory protein GabR [Ensifer sp. M14]
MGQPDGRRSRRTGAARRIYLDLREQIGAGVYAPGDRLPSSRALAEELGVSRTTVTAAFDQLVSEGYVTSRQGSASIVTDMARPGTLHGRHAEHRLEWPLSDYAVRLMELPIRYAERRKALEFDFRYGDIAAADFPTLLWRRAMNAALLRRRDSLSYEHPAGSAALRQQLQGYLWRGRGIRCDVDQIIVVSGSQQALDLCARVLVNIGDRVILEEPCYAMARNVMAAAGADIVAVSCDNSGLLVGELPHREKSVLAFVTPSHQFPLGGVLPQSRRDALLQWAYSVGAYIVEDDYDGEYRYDVKPIPPLFQSDRERVIYVGTVSKTLSPALRLGYLIVPRPLIDVFTRCKQLADRHSPSLEQEALAILLEAGSYERHVRKMRRSNAERRAALIAALTSCFGEKIDIVGTSAGLHVVVWFRGIGARHEARLIEAARAAGIGIYPVSPLYLARKPDVAGLVLGYAALTPDELRRGAEKLASTIYSFAPFPRNENRG